MLRPSNRHIVEYGLAAALVLVVIGLTIQFRITQKQIPLQEIIATHGGKRHFADVFPVSADGADLANEYQKRFSGAHYSGASNMFLVNAATARDAISASMNVFFAGQSADTPTMNKPSARTGNYWLVVYMGIGPSQPAWWVAEGASIRGSRIRFSYNRAPASGSTRDIRHYYYWVPLGELKDGSYQLELFDSGSNETTVTRQVNVVAKGSMRH